MAMCWRCGQRLQPCLCPHIPRLETRTHLVLLMHPKEFKKERLGTGRMTCAALPSSEILMGVNFDEDRRVRQLAQDPANACFVLWPGEESLPAERMAEVLGERRPVVFLLDGTWPCARKMYRSSPVLQTMPKIGLTPTRLSRFQIKQQPNAQCLSTVEAAELLFETLEAGGVEGHRPWHELTVPFDELNRRQLEIAMDPDRQGYRRKTKPDPGKIRERMLAGTRQRKLF